MTVHDQVVGKIWIVGEREGDWVEETELNNHHHIIVDVVKLCVVELLLMHRHCHQSCSNPGCRLKQQVVGCCMAAERVHWFHFH